jgi:hypothetical protein
MTHSHNKDVDLPYPYVWREESLSELLEEGLKRNSPSDDKQANAHITVQSETSTTTETQEFKPIVMIDETHDTESKGKNGKTLTFRKGSGNQSKFTLK